MKKTILMLIVALFPFFYAGSIAAQTSSLSSEELTIFKEEIKNRVNRFQMYLTFIASKKNNKSTKQAYVNQALKLFMGKGEKYRDVYDNIQPAVRVQLSNTRTKEKYWRVTKNYLNNLINLNYKELEITWADVCRVADFYKVRDGLYVTTVTISQRFTASRDNATFINNDVKTITVYLEEEVTTVGGQYRILFGDIEVVETY